MEANKSCECSLCKAYDTRRWETIESCQCACHTSDKIAGHDSLCCEFPNGKKKDNPYKVDNIEVKYETVTRE